MPHVPLKLGLMRASYPDVLPMSLSRKSEGDICGPALLEGFVSSLQELSLTPAGRQQRDHEHRNEREYSRNSRGGGGVRSVREKGWECRCKKVLIMEK